MKHCVTFNVISAYMDVATNCHIDMYILHLDLEEKCRYSDYRCVALLFV